MCTSYCIGDFSVYPWSINQHLALREMSVMSTALELWFISVVFNTSSWFPNRPFPCPLPLCPCRFFRYGWTQVPRSFSHMESVWGVSPLSAVITNTTIIAISETLRHAQTKHPHPPRIHTLPESRSAASELSPNTPSSDTQFGLKM